jgi:lipopolysaccharide export system protein LptA
LLLILAGALPPTALGLPEDRELPIEVEADRAVRDERRGYTVYTGSVRLTQGSLVIDADKLTIFHSTASAERVVALGAPARMRQRPAADEAMIRAEALRITYLAAEERVLLEDTARVEQDGATVSGERINYLIPEQLVRADAAPDSEERVQVVIPAQAAADEEEPEPPAGPAASEETPIDGPAESN